MARKTIKAPTYSAAEWAKKTGQNIGPAKPQPTSMGEAIFGPDRSVREQEMANHRRGAVSPLSADQRGNVFKGIGGVAT